MDGAKEEQGEEGGKGDECEGGNKERREEIGGEMWRRRERKNS